MIRVWNAFVRGTAFERGAVVKCDQNLDGEGCPDLYHAERMPMIDGMQVDYYPVVVGDLLCSARMRSVIESVAAPDDGVKWTPVTLLVRGEEPTGLWRLEFSRVADVLDEERSMFNQYGAERMLFRPVFSAMKCRNHSVFADRPNCRHAFCVTNVARRELAKLEPRKQFKFNPAPVSYDT